MSAAPINEVEAEALTEDGVGLRLRQAREALNLGRGEVAAGLYLSESIVKALEEDDREVLPGPVFVQGYLRKYARLLGISEEPLLLAYSRQAGSNKRNKKCGGPLAGSPIKPEMRSNHTIIRLITWIIVLGLLGLVAMWWQRDMQWPIGQSADDQSMVVQDVQPQFSAVPGLPGTDDDHALNEGELEEQNITESVAPEAAAELETEAQSLMVAPDDNQMERLQGEPLAGDLLAEAIERKALGSEVVSGSEVVETGESAVREGTQAPEFESGVASGDATEALRVVDSMAEKDAKPEISIADSADEQIPAPPIDYANSLVIEFSEPCWAEIRGFDGSYKLLGNMQKNERHVLGGEPPYSFVLGNSQAVTLTVKGQPFDIEAHSKGNVARFVIQAEDIPNL